MFFSCSSMLAVRVMMLLALCRYCSAQDGGCTPPAGSNLISGTGKLSNNIPESNRGPIGRESIKLKLFVSRSVCSVSRAERSHWRQWSRLVGNVQ